MATTTKEQYEKMTNEEKRAMLLQYRDRLTKAAKGLGTDEEEFLKIGQELNSINPNLITELDKLMGGVSIQELIAEEFGSADPLNIFNKKYKQTAIEDAFFPLKSPDAPKPDPVFSEPQRTDDGFLTGPLESAEPKSAPESSSPTLDAPAIETLDEISVEEPAPQQDAQQKQVSVEEPANRLAASQAPILQTDPKTTGPGDITRRNIERELAAEGAADVRKDIFNERRQRRIDGISDSREADMAESWATSPTGRRDGRKWSELDPETKNEMRGRFVDYRENMATPSMDDPGLRGPQGPQGSQGPSGMPSGAPASPQPSTAQPNLDDPKPMQGPQQPAPMQGPNPMSDQDMYDMMDQATAPKAPKGPTQGPPQDDFRAEQYIKKEMEKSEPRTSPTVPNPNYDYSTKNNPAVPLDPKADPNDKRTYRPNPGGQMVRVPVYGKGGYTGYTEGRDGRFVQAPKGFDQKRHFNSINHMAPHTKKQEQMERQARRGNMENPFTFVDTDRGGDNFLKEYQYNRARDEKRKYKGTFNPYA